MRSYDKLKEAEADQASWEAAQGGVVGALKWGLGAAVLGAVGYKVSPIYRGTTIQFKVYVIPNQLPYVLNSNPSRYLQMSGMVLGGMIEADWRLRQFEQQVRMQRRVQRERDRWDQIEEEFGKGGGK